MWSFSFSFCGPSVVSVWCLIQFSHLLGVTQMTQARPDHYNNQHKLAEQQHLNTSNINHRIHKLPGTLIADVDYFDKLNVESLLANRRFVDLQIKCLIYDGPADLFCRKTKSLLPSVILDNCRLCSETQRQKLNFVIVHLQQNYPSQWRDAIAKYGGSLLQAGPSSQIFGKKQGQNDYSSIASNYQSSSAPAPPQTTEPVPVLIEPQSAVEAETASLGLERLYESSPAPDQLISVVESPTPPMNPTTSPHGHEHMFATSSAQPPSTPVVESTIEVKPTTMRPSRDREEE